MQGQGLNQFKQCSSIKSTPTHSCEKQQPITAPAQPEQQENKWLHGDGSPLNDDELLKETQTWKPSDWEEYLSTEESYQREEYQTGVGFC